MNTQGYLNLNNLLHFSNEFVPTFTDKETQVAIPGPLVVEDTQEYKMLSENATAVANGINFGVFAFIPSENITSEDASQMYNFRYVVESDVWIGDLTDFFEFLAGASFYGNDIVRVALNLKEWQGIYNVKDVQIPEFVFDQQILDKVTATMGYIIDSDADGKRFNWGNKYYALAYTNGNLIDRAKSIPEITNRGPIIKI